MEETDIENKPVKTGRRERAREIPVNFKKYEGKTESEPARSDGLFARSAREARILIGELSAIVLFLRKSSSELSTSY